MSSEDSILSDEIIKAIQDVADSVLTDSGFEDIIKDGIFNLLENKCTVIYFPLRDEKNRGFHIKKLVKDHLEDFVYINTDKTVEQQAFTAAHELGHILNVYGTVCSKLNNSIEISIDDHIFEERVINRFAAELLMPEKKFVKETIIFATELEIKDNATPIKILKLIAKLMDRFFSPFNAVRKRLFEVGIIDSEANRILRENKIELENLVDFLKKDDNSLINSNTEVKTITGLRTLIEEASKNPSVDKSLIEKIKYDFDVKDVSNIEINNIRFSRAPLDESNH